MCGCIVVVRVWMCYSGRLIVFGDAESAERALREYNDSVLNNRNMKLRKVLLV